MTATADPVKKDRKTPDRWTQPEVARAGSLFAIEHARNPERDQVIGFIAADLGRSNENVEAKLVELRMLPKREKVTLDLAVESNIDNLIEKLVGNVPAGQLELGLKYLRKKIDEILKPVKA